MGHEGTRGARESVIIEFADRALGLFFDRRWRSADVEIHGDHKTVRKEIERG